MFDSHTHILKHNAVVNLDPVDLRGGVRLRKGYSYSVGIHPWNVFATRPTDLLSLRALAIEPAVLAIGECGLDAKLTDAEGRSREGILSAQTQLLHFHFRLSEQLAKPLILHIVKAFPEIINLKRQWRPTQPWIIHSFRGKPQLARELLDHGFYLSFGEKYNPESFDLTPASRRLRETDAL